MTQASRYLLPLNSLAGVRADFIGRIPGVQVDTDREVTIKRLRPAHKAAVAGLGFDWTQLHLAEQVHGAGIAVVRKVDSAQTWPNVDGLITPDAGLRLGIYVAECGAVYIGDPVKRVVALLHSGKKGTEANITGKAISMMQEEFGSSPSDMVVALSPCVRPPMYEVDIARQIREQAIEAGVPEQQFTDSGICTGSDLTAYYSYRVEKGNTGRMLALLGMV
jgi:copper oxidase (laccase) domain-containing protein